jgi:hypothetical protein
MTTPLIRRTVPLALVPLAVAAGVLACLPWLHSFPSGVIALPLFGAAVISTFVPVVAVRLGASKLWMSLLIDLVCFVLYGLLVVLREPFGFADLVDGIYRGPSQILTFALPLVSPRTLLIAPVTLTWLAGTLAGECLTRRWFTVLPYPGFLISYGLAYAGTVRAVESGTNSSNLNQTLIAALLLGVLMLLRAAQTWVRQDETAESTQADGILPMRGLVVGAVLAAVIALVAGFSVQSSAFTRRATTPQRVPSVHDSRPLTPVAFIASLRPLDPKASGQPVFTVQTDRAALGYFGIANVDLYDGSGWSFQRSFRPSGGVLPADTDQALKASGPIVTQEYRIADGPLAGQPWMPYVYRAEKVTGTSVNIDADSGMIVPAGALRSGEQYRVQSQPGSTAFAKLPPSAVADTGTAAVNTVLPEALRQPLADLVTAFGQETGTPTSPAIGFLQALQRDLQQRYSLIGAAPTTAAPSTSGHDFVQPPLGSTPTVTPSPTATVKPGARAASTSFADVLASIVGTERSGTPEQYATLVALVARQLGVPARLVTGFRVTPPTGRSTLAAGRYDVTTAQAWTWVEIPVVGSGWVVLDASPSMYSNSRARPTTTATTTPTPTTTPTQNALITQSNHGHAIAPKSTVPSSPGSSQRALVVSLLITFGVLLLAALVLLALRKPVRRRRRQAAPDPRVRAMGAWRESIDVLTEAGLPDLSSMTSSEIVDVTGAQFGSESARQTALIGQTANTAAYSTLLTLAPQDADAAWQAERVLRRQVTRQLRGRERVLAWLRYHRVGPDQPTVGPTSWSAAKPTDRRPARSPAALLSRLRRRAH